MPASKRDRGMRPSFELAGRDHFLRDVEEKGLLQLMDILRMPCNVDPQNLALWWVQEQEGKIIQLDSRLRKPTDLLSRAAMRLGKQKIRYFPEPASLCRLHRELDPRVIHNLLIMIGNECTLRSDKYRKACRYERPGLRHLPLPKEAEAWVDRLDQIYMMRLNDVHAFERIFGYMPRLKPLKNMRYCDCEACVLAVIGGHEYMLADLWASVKLRQNAYRTYHRGRDPRINRVIRAWCETYGSERVRYIRKLRNSIIPHLEKARDIIIENERIESEAMREEGKHSKKHESHHHRRRRRRRRSRSERKHRSYSFCPTASSEHRREQADKAMRPQSGCEMIRKGSRSSRETSTATQMMAWPSPFEFQVVEGIADLAERQSAHESDGLKSGEEDEEDQAFPVSPLTEDDEHEHVPFGFRIAHPEGDSLSTPHERAVVDDDIEIDEYEEEEDEVAAAEEWFQRRTAYLDPCERLTLAQALPAFSTYQAMSAVPEPLYPTEHNKKEDEEADVDERGSWYSATVHTYMPVRGRDQEHDSMPYFASGQYASTFGTGGHIHAEEDMHENAPLAWSQWEKRFVNKEALAKLEGR